MLGLSLCGTWMTACGGDGSGVSEKVATVLDEKRVLAGAAAQSMSLGSGSETTDLLFPAGILKTPATLTVRLSKDVVKTGAAPTGPCVQVANKGVIFAVAAQMRQVLPPPATGMHYVGVHADEQAAAWTEQADARVAGALSGDGDGGPSGGGDGGGGSNGGTTATWEIDMNGSGLWAMALVPIGGTNGDGGIVDDAGGPGTVDGGDPSTRPQLTQIVPAQGTAGTLVPVEIHGRNITSGWSIVVDGQLVSTTIAPVSLNGVSDGNGALGAVMLDATIVTGQVPVWLALGDLRLRVRRRGREHRGAAIERGQQLPAFYRLTPLDEGLRHLPARVGGDLRLGACPQRPGQRQILRHLPLDDRRRDDMQRAGCVALALRRGSLVGTVACDETEQGDEG